MKRLAAALAVTVLSLLGTASLAVPAAFADVDDFEFASFHADYHLGTDDEGHSTLRTVETLVAVFPETDQNRGIVRTLPTHYYGIPTNLTVVSVTDEDGQAVEFEEEDADGGIALALGGDDYVHGEQTYVVEYTQQHVTRYYEDTDADEFYWDVNGVDWAQPFGTVSATLHLEPGLEERVTDAAAYVGAQGETGAGTVDGLEFEASDLGPHENLTIVVAFEPGTFVPRATGFFDAPWPTIAAIGAFGALLSFVLAFVVRLRVLRDHPGRGIIVPEYGPPKGISLMTSAHVIGRAAKVTPAQIIALAVDGRIRLVEKGTKGLLNTPQYRLELVSADGVEGHEREFLHALFGSTLTPGERRDLDKQDEKAAKKVSELSAKVMKEMTSEGYRRPYPTRVALPVLLLGGLSTLVGIIFSAIALDQAYGGAIPGITLAASLVFGALSFIPLIRNPLSEKGVAVRDHMTGLKQYIELAEADRLRYLQSPKGALRDPIATDDTAQVVKLNEKLLPYAMIFGHEKEWAEELGRYYEERGSTPDWYVGSGPFNAAVFASSVGSVSTSTASTFSSSSGGSGGGGFSGGGGGGGGGGGR